MELLTDFEANGSFEHVAQNVRVYDSENFAWYVRATDLENHTPLTSVRYVDESSYRFLKKTALFGNEVLITKRGEIGKVYLFEQKCAFATLAPNLYLLKLKRTVLPGYVYAYFKYGVGNQAIKAINASTTLGALYKNDVKALLLPCPPLPEQRAIVAALSDVDALLDVLDQLIAKKRHLKQAAIQQLLTGHTRLPGFSGEWEVKRLGDVAMLKNGYAFKSDTYTSLGKFKVVTIANVQHGYMTADDCNTIASEPLDLQPHQRLRRGDILISMTGNVGRVCRVDEDHCLLNQRVGKIVPVGIIEAILFALLGQASFISAMTGVAKGGAQPNLSASDITEHPFNIPKDAAEQTAIAEVLAEMDGELVVLEQRRKKTRALKLAMMQELLTGRTRLI